MRTSLLISFMLGCLLKLSAQSEYLRIGSPVPEFKIEKFHDQTNRYFDNETLDIKHTILSFWTPGCTSCIKMFPKYDELSDLFKDSLNFILIGRDHPFVMQEFQKQKNRLKLRFDAAYTDKDFFSKFGVQSVPTYIWIDKDRIVKAVTWSEEFNEANILRFINGEDFEFVDQSIEAQKQRTALKEASDD